MSRWLMLLGACASVVFVAVANVVGADVMIPFFQRMGLSMNWRLQDFGSVGDQGETAWKAPTQGVLGAKAPRTVVKFHF